MLINLGKDLGIKESGLLKRGDHFEKGYMYIINIFFIIYNSS